MERQNETLQDSLMKYHQEQRALLDKVNMLQQQLTQVNNTTRQQTAELERKSSSAKTSKRNVLQHELLFSVLIIFC